MSVKLGLRFCSKIVACGLLLASLLPVSVQAQTLSWKQQLGTSDDDSSEDVATDSLGNVYISGYTDGSLAGPNNAGTDAWVAKYSTHNQLLWKKQLGLFGPDVVSNGVAIDSNDNVYISGYTFGSLGASNQGSGDAFVAKYNSSGALVWTRQLGTSAGDSSLDVATDSKGNVYISGNTGGSLAGANQGGSDTWVAKYNSSGNLVWKRQLGSSEQDSSNGVATDSLGNVYISGGTYGSLGGPHKGTSEDDAWVAKYNSSGALEWTRQLGTIKSDESRGVATDKSGNVYISGVTAGPLGGPNQGFGDSWVAKYNSSGTRLWTRQLGTSGGDGSHSVATDSVGNVYISGETGITDADAFVAKYSTTGNLVWNQRLKSSAYDLSYGVAVNLRGDVYISGLTYGSLGGAYQGGTDAWVVKYTQ